MRAAAFAFMLRSRRRRVVAWTAGIFLAIVAVSCGGWLLYKRHLELPVETRPTVRIATWNLRQFSQTRKGVDFLAIADIVRANRFDVLAIQEVKGEGEAITLLVAALGLPWRAVELSDVTGNRQRFAFIYNAERVEAVGTPRFISTADAVIFDRIPYQQSFRAGNFDFTLVTCHLYYGEGRAGVDRRRKEAEALLRFVERSANFAVEHDWIILGDLNETRGKENLPAFVEAGWKVLNTEPTNLGGKEVYDNLLIDPKFTPEWSGRAGAVRFDDFKFRGNDKAARESVSDHRPAYADFVTNLPDDD